MGILGGDKIDEQAVEGDRPPAHAPAQIRQRDTGLEVKKRRFFAGCNGHDHPLKQLGGSFDQINMAIGDGVESARVHHGMGQHSLSSK